jgi:hypothetical protein
VAGGEIHPLGEGEDEGAGDFITVRQGDVIGWQQAEGGRTLLHEQAQQQPQSLVVVEHGEGERVVHQLERTFSVKVECFLRTCAPLSALPRPLFYSRNGCFQALFVDVVM